MSRDIENEGARASDGPMQAASVARRNIPSVRHSQEWCARAIGWTLVALIVVCAALLFIGGGTYFVKSMTESHNVLLVAANIRDVASLLVQDVAASPDAAAHPYWYIHHPNLVAKILSWLLGTSGLALEGQVSVMVALNVAGLAALVAALRRISPAAALGALLVATTSYGSFHFNAGDLCRGPLYLLLWALIVALLKNPTLSDRRYNLAVGIVAALSALSDWGFALFVVGFSLSWSVLGRGHLPWRWFLTYVVAFMGVALAIFVSAVIAAVGWTTFWLDVKVTYLGRLGVGEFVDYESVLTFFADHNVVMWPAQGHGTDSIVQLVGALATLPLLNTGPAWVLLMPCAVWATTTTLVRLGWRAVQWAGTGLLACLNFAGLLPLPALAAVVLAAACGLKRVPMGTPVHRLCGLVTAVVLGLLLLGTVFPAFTMSFVIAGGRPPMPLLEMATGALLAELLIAGHLARALAALARSTSIGRLLNAASHTGWVVIAVITAALVAIAGSDGSFFGIPRSLALGLWFTIAAGVLVTATMLGRLRAGHVTGNATILQVVERHQLAVFLALAAFFLAMHKSAAPDVFGRYSSRYAILIAAIAFSAFAAGALVHLSSARLPPALQTALVSLRGAFEVGRSSAQRAAMMVALVLAGGQFAWLLLSVIARPPRPVPYAETLAREEFRGKSFVTTSYEGITWYSTRGWAYMTAANPPLDGSFGTRFRHFADWRSEKYDRPDYYLCDNTGFSYVRPGMSWEAARAKPLACVDCTCRDVAATFAAAGDEVVVDRDDFAIVRLKRY